MIEVFAAFALGAASTGAACFFAERLARTERDRLLDRVMAPDYHALKTYEPREAPAAPKVSAEERREQDEIAHIIDAAHGLA